MNFTIPPLLLIVAMIAVLNIIFTILHEIGHAIPILLSGNKAHIFIGSATGVQVQLGRLKMTFGWDGITSIASGYCAWETSREDLVVFFAYIGGPIMSLAICVGMSFIVDFNSQTAFGKSILYVWFGQIFILVITAIPIQYPDWWPSIVGDESDGKQALDLLLD